MLCILIQIIKSMQECMTAGNKILIIINNLGVGGAERLVVEDINEMIERGIDVYLLTLKKEKVGKTLIHDCKIESTRHFTVDMSDVYDISGWIGVSKIIRQIQPKAVITHLWFSNVVGRISAALLGVSKIVSFEHNMYDTVKNKRMFLIDRVLQYFSHTIIAVSDPVKNSLVRHGINQHKIHVLVNGIDLNKFKSPSLVKKSDFGLKDSDFVFVSVARLIHQKGIDVLIDALTHVPGAYLLLVGEGDKKDVLIEQAHERGLENRVIFAGIRDDVPSILGMADCFVLASRYEGLGIVVLEAMAAGLPVIVSDFEASSSMITNRVDGMIVKREDVECLSEAMCLMVYDSQLRNTFRQNALVKVQHFSIQYHVDRLLNLL